MQQGPNPQQNGGILLSVFSVATKTPRKRRSLLWRRILRYKWIYIMMLLPVAYFIIFKYIPIYGVQLAFKNYSVRKGISASPWNGFEHFHYMMSEPGFVPAFRNTLIISFLRILFGFPVPIILALAINEVRLKRYSRVVQTTLTFPHFLSWVLLGGIFLNMFGTNGVVRKIVDAFNPEAAKNWNFLYNASSFRMLLVLSDIWKEAGWGTIIYLAAIAGVDPAIEEAAMIDGCNRWKRILHVTLPGIFSMVAIQFVLRVGAVMEGGFDQVFNLYTAPVFSTGDILDTYIYRLSFVYTNNINVGFPVAVGLFKNIINLALLLMANAFARMLGQESVL